LRFGALAAVAVGAAACSSEAVRLSENPNASPYAAAPANQMAAQPAPVGRIERQPLPQYQSQYQPQYQPPPPPPPPATPEVTGAVHSGGHWDWQGGTPVVVAQGETIIAIAHRHNVPAHEILRANGLAASATLQAGQRLVIPRYIADGGSAKLAHAAIPRHPAPPAAAIAAAAPPTPGEHVVASGETLSSIARKHRITIRELAAANSMTPETPLKVGMKLNVPARTGSATKTASLAPVTPVAAAPARPPTLQSVKPGEQPAASARIATPAVEATADEPGPAAAAGMPSFRWPLRGRVTTNFGAKTAGGASDGIDLAVPEGTAVRAADDGVVAYAGNELKGYGNLVLIRHANGFVTAYANASEINVKRNDQVHRGQVIAKSGQTGSAATPQLHFEIRKNSAPVDPVQYLPSDKTASAPL
jgi:murein DD-endopeptidase MepM/ murein hydrolase activator NlpD